MSMLYKRSNRLWRLLIRHRLVHAVWRSFVEWTRWRHLGFRRRLAAEHAMASRLAGGAPVCQTMPAGV
jgi:hypothetical protein